MRNETDYVMLANERIEKQEKRLHEMKTIANKSNDAELDDMISQFEVKLDKMKDIRNEIIDNYEWEEK